MPLNTVTIPNEIFFAQAKEFIDAGHDVTITVVGRSMEPFFESHRDEVKLTKCRKAKVDDMIVAFTKDKRYIAHRVIKVDGENITMRGDGNVFGTELTTQEDIIGLVSAYRRKGKTKYKPMYRAKWKIYSLLWPQLTIVRRILLAFHHHIYLKLYKLLFNPEWMNIK